MHNDRMEIREVWRLDREAVELKLNFKMIMFCVRSCFKIQRKIHDFSLWQQAPLLFFKICLEMCVFISFTGS